MSRPRAHRTPVCEASLPRLLATSILAVLLAAGAHLAAGGSVTAAAGVLLAAAVLVGSSTWLAREIGRRSRGLTAAAAPIGTAQGGLELLFWSSGHGIRDPLLAVGLHAGAGLVLVVLVLGLDRVAADLRAASDRFVPVVCWSRGPERARGGSNEVTADDADDVDSRWQPELCPVRGPPLPL